MASALAVSVSAAHAGVVLQISTQDLSVANSKPAVAIAYAQDGKLRIERGENSRFVSIQTRQAAIDIDTSTHSYHMRDQDELTRLGAEQKALQEKSAAERAAPPANGSSDLATMLDRVNSSTEENLALQKQTPDFRATDRHDAVDGHSCAIWEYYWKDKKEEEFCIVSPKLIPGGAEWIAALRSVGDFYDNACQWLGDPGRLLLAPMRAQAEAPSRLGGIPFLTRTFREGAVASESRVTTVRVEPLDPVLFEVPKDYVRN